MIASLLVLAGCGSIDYLQQQPGTFSGSLFVMWVDEGSASSGDGRFVFVPSPNTPLTFTRPNGLQPATVIRPGVMYTDGGSIPKIAQVFKGLSPWGYAPAYMIHDWLFEAQHCFRDGVEDPRFAGLDMSFDESARVLGEAIQALVASNKVQANDIAGGAITSAVSGAIARNLWERTGACNERPVSADHLAEIEAAFPRASDAQKARSFRVSPDDLRIRDVAPGRIVAVVEF